MFSILQGERQALSYALIIYIFSLFILLILKPEISYEGDKAKMWGIGQNKTLFPIYILSMIISILSLFIMTIIFTKD